MLVSSGQLPQRVGEEVIVGTYVLVRGAWHSGKELEPVAMSIKADGHTVVMWPVVPVAADPDNPDG
jgi:hypothetical protein